MLGFEYLTGLNGVHKPLLPLTPVDRLVSSIVSYLQTESDFRTQSLRHAQHCTPPPWMVRRGPLGHLPLAAGWLARGQPAR